MQIGSKKCSKRSLFSLEEVFKKEFIRFNLVQRSVQKRVALSKEVFKKELHEKKEVLNLES